MIRWFNKILCWMGLHEYSLGEMVSFNSWRFTCRHCGKQTYTVRRLR